MWNIFEHPWGLLIVALTVQFVFTIIHMIKPNSRKLLHLVPVILIVTAAFAVDYFVQTDREQIITVVKTAVQAAEEENAREIERLIAPDYKDSRHANKNEIMATCQTWFARPLIERNELRGLELEIGDQQAQALFFVVVHVDKRNDIYGTVGLAVVKTKLILGKLNGKWLINSAEIIEVNNQSFNWGSL
jgi:hypothetical protein